MKTLLAERLATAAAEAGKPLHAVTISPGPYKGDRYICVNGKPWGEAKYQSKGKRGASYIFCQITKAHENGGFFSRRVLLVPNNLKSFVMLHSEPGRDVQISILEWAQKLVGEGHLRDPADVMRELEAAAEEVRARQAERKQHEQAEWLRRAHECLEPLAGHVASLKLADAAAKIVDAMKWAQTQ